MIETMYEKEKELQNLKYMGFFEKPSEPSYTCYWKKSKRDYTALTASQKERRVDK